MAIHVGIGGWNFAPWRGTFYPPGLAHTRELHFASRHVSAIEINGTFYRTQSPESFARWAAEAPDGFIFAVKAARGATYRSDPAAAADSIAHFLHSGLTRLGPKLGPILWQFPPTRRFDRAAVSAFLQLLPPEQDGVRLRHVIEAAHPTFNDLALIDLLRCRGVARAMVERTADPAADTTADFVYARLERNDAGAPEGYSSPALDAWAARLQAWSDGRPVTDLRYTAPLQQAAGPLECFAFFISGDKQRAPDSARAMLARLAGGGTSVGQPRSDTHGITP